MKRRLLPVLGTLLVLLAFVLLVMGCSGAARESTERRTETQPDAVAPTGTPTGLTGFDSGSGLRVKGRDRFRACVEVLDESIGVEDAVAALAEALLTATEDRRWHIDFRTPAVDIGCPLPPGALGSTAPRFDERICRPEVSPYAVYVFVGDAALFEERFPEDRLQRSFPVPGLRRAAQEYIAVGGGPRCEEVAEAWYATPDDLSDDALLQAYIFGFFPIAEICC